MTRLLLWSGLGAWRAEASWVELGPDGLSATGTQLGVDPVPYRLDYQLETGPHWITSRLDVVSAGQGWRRHLDLRHDGAGSWTCSVEQEGTVEQGGVEQGGVELPDAGGDLATVTGAVDCDLGRSPLTNLMPIRRHELHRQAGGMDFLMAWVSVPDLAVHPSRQWYEHLRATAGGADVRYVGAHRGFEGQLELDRDGIVVRYPDLARRVTTAGEGP